MSKLTLNELNQKLAGFTGTINWYRHWTNLLAYTDGVNAMAEAAGSFWLIDAIASWQIKPKVARCDFQAWALTVKDDRTATLQMREDTGLQPVVTQEIVYTDFPCGTFTLWVEGSGRERVLLLPSEH
jgi:hypothetical protein